MSMRALCGRSASSFILVAIVVSYLAFNDGRAGMADKPVETAAQRLETALGSTAEFDFTEMPFVCLIASLEKQHGIEIHLDTKAMIEANVALDTPLTLQVKGLSLRSGLRLLLRQLDMKAFIKEDQFWITTKDVHDDFVEPRVYEVRDLLVKPGGDPSDKSQYEFESLIDLLQNTIQPDSWNCTGGPGSIEPVEDSGVLVISMNPQIHDEINDLLSMLRRARDQQLAGGKLKPVAERTLSVIHTRASAAPAIRKALARRTKIDNREIPLNAMLEEFAHEWNIPVVIDNKALTDANVAIDSVVSFQSKNCLVGEGLTSQLVPLDLRWTICDEVLWVTTKDVADDMRTLCVYPIADFDDDGVAGLAGNLGKRIPLLDVLQNSIRPDSWSGFGGPGSIEYFPNVRSLVIAQTDQGHAAVEKLLASLRQVRAKQAATPVEIAAANINDDAQHLKVYRIAPMSRTAQALGGMGGGGGYFAVRDQQPQESEKEANEAAPRRVPGAVLPQMGGAQPNPQQPAPPPFDPTEDLARIIPLVIEPTSWKEGGGTGVIQSLPG